MNDMRIITGQQPCVTRAKKSIAGFHVREGQAIGCKVTLRGDRMWEFLDRLLATALPRVRDFRGISPTSFDGRGNYTLGVTEQLIFPRSTTTRSIAPWHGHHVRHDGGGQRERLRAAFRAGLPVQEQVKKRPPLAGGACVTSGIWARTIGLRA